jgi:ribosomal protein S6--L-glutamate ligase
MKTVYVLSRGENLYSTRRLVEAGEKRGWDIQVIDYLQCTVEIMKGDLKVNYQGKELPIPDAIIPRIGASRTFFGTAIVRHFEMMNVFTTAGSLAITRSRDKLRALQILSKHDVDMPKTVFASKGCVTDIHRLIGNPPWVLKILEGTQGVGVVLVDNRKAAKSVLDAFNGMNVHMLIQEYIEEAGGSDIRALVVNGKVIGAMKRQGAEGDFRSNLHQGGTATVYELSDEEKKTALAAAKAMGLSVCGVDMIPSSRGPLVMEVNSSPGLQGIENATGIDIADEIMECIEISLSNDDSKLNKDTIGA